MKSAGQRLICPFADGADGLAQTVPTATEAGLVASAGGSGDTVAALRQAGLADRFSDSVRAPGSGPVA